MVYIPTQAHPEMKDFDELRRYTEDELRRIAQALAEVDPRPNFSAILAANQTGIPNAVNSKVLVTTEEWDVGGYYDATNSKWTPPAGKYIFTASTLVTAGVVDQATYQTLLYKNGVQYRVFATAKASGVGSLGPGGATMADGNGSDYFEFYFYGDGGGTKSLFANSTITFFQGQMVSSA